MLSSKFKRAVSVLLLIMFFVAATQTLVLAENGRSSLESAEASVNQAYVAVLAAERAGGNVSGLLVQFNVAAGLLAEAENAYRFGSPNLVSAKAGEAITIANAVQNEASRLKEASLAGAQTAFWLTLVFSIVGAVVFSVILFYLWRWFKRFYVKRMLNMKPELTE